MRQINSEIFFIAYITSLLLITSNISGQERLIKFNDKKIAFEGRIKTTSEAAILSWPGSSVNVFFKGTSIKAELKDSDTSDYFNVIADGKFIKKIHPDSVRRIYVLAENLSAGYHYLELFKRTESDKGHCTFYGVILKKNDLLMPVKNDKIYSIEFYGNSITCGYGVEDTNGDSGIGYYENNYLSYAAIAARYFNAHYTCIAKSGIGVTVSWFPLIMPEMYDRLVESEPELKWSFKSKVPGIVVVDLFQNDSWLVKMPQNELHINRFSGINLSDSFFVTSYERFISALRSKYPLAKIICTLGDMDASKSGSPWKTYIIDAVKKLKDKNIFTYFFDFKYSPGHPKIMDQNLMANGLIKFINHLGWRIMHRPVEK